MSRFAKIKKKIKPEVKNMSESMSRSVVPSAWGGTFPFFSAPNPQVGAPSLKEHKDLLAKGEQENN